MADIRAAIVISISIPMAFFFSLIILWFSPFTLNMVTLSGLIISVIVYFVVYVLSTFWEFRKTVPKGRVLEKRVLKSLAGS